MKWLLATAVIALLTGADLADGAFAQTAAPPANRNASTPPIANPNENNPGAPAAGANSFSEAQAKSRIEGSRLLQRFRSGQRQRRNLERQGF